ncbi:metal dependent phosphohydrolase [Isosphaera pallida ATCC 43644]|uniref:Metal dependent phosphohydrolase n=1 Tax=Isosphaera pallida (strain ATCC 43644 / DSM 9630 / IS1B) TaxID=575540 RepID=E8QWH8_ISOPI|nr:HDIG domain-containing metalloprotein [Isosphaera pallida]ADV61870.1 metal dependent phosphohydrolase [Isosphaera pallida ATCC 43644]
MSSARSSLRVGKLQRGHLRPIPWDPRDRERLARQQRRGIILATVATAYLATCLLILGDGPPLEYRLGDRPSRDVVVKVERLERIDPVRTNAAAQQRYEAVPPYMVNQPTPIVQLTNTLKSLFDTLAETPSYGDLNKETLEAWKALDPSTFATIKRLTTNPDDLAQLRNLVDRFFEPILKRGILGPDALPAGEQRYDRLLVVTHPVTAGSGSNANATFADPKATGTVPDPLVSSPTRLGYKEVERDLVTPESMARLNGKVHVEFQEALARVLPNLDAASETALFNLIASKFATAPSLKFDPERTTAARELAKNDPKAEPARVILPRGSVLIPGGQTVTLDHLELLRLEREVAQRESPTASVVSRLISIGILVAMVFGMMAVHLQLRHGDVARDPWAVAGICLVTVSALFIARLLSWEPHDADLGVIAFAAMVMSVAFKPSLALTLGFGLAVLTTLIRGGGFDDFLVIMGGLSAGILTLDDVRTRTKVLTVGLATGTGFALLSLAVGLANNQAVEVIASECFWRFIWSVLAGLFLGGTLPLIERAGGLVTGVSLLELGDQTHPLLQELVRRAPGTHNHSMTVATIAEAAAKRIGADALLVRVGAYFHDIGKMFKPDYFVENQSNGRNRHANLAPAMSTLVIIGHVKDGVELARSNGLPQKIIDFIEQHHGTTLVEYFYRQAQKLEKERDNDGHTQISESAFRYPGPKPRHRETAILMIADACESASRTLSEPTPGRLEGLVADIIEKRLRDGQFDQCGLTLRELAEIRESIVKSLTAIYHGRVKYPDQKSA